MAKRKTKKRKASRRGPSQPAPIDTGGSPDRRAIEALMRQLLPAELTGGNQSDAAQDLVYEAYEKRDPKRRIALARKALEISPDCADAYVLLAEHAETLPEALDYYQQGVDAGERALGEDGFEEFVGHFWGYLPTRPYMRAREGLADCLWSSGRHAEAIEHFQEMLRLNPGDNQGIRYRLVAIFLDLEWHDELQKLFAQYEDDCMAEWVYSRALLAFRQEGDTQRTRELLREAEEINAYVPEYLLNGGPIPSDGFDHITWGGEDEAICYARRYLPAWKNTPGAVTWLRNTLKKPVVGRSGPDISPQQAKAAIAKLPQAKNEIWLMDLRSVPGESHARRPANSDWGLLIVDSVSGNLVDLELFQGRPKDRTVWERLTTAMLEPRDREPRRPAEIHVERKAWVSAWKSRLKKLGINCRMCEHELPLDAAFDNIKYTLSHSHMPGDEADAEAELPGEEALKLGGLGQTDEIWQAVVLRVPTWLEMDGELKRPWILLVVETASEAIIATELFGEDPTPGRLSHVIRHAMQHPAVGPARRPDGVEIGFPPLYDNLRGTLEPIDVRCVVSENLTIANRVALEMIESIAGPRRQASLVDSPGVKLEQIGSFFAAAADFYRRRPWKTAPSDTVIRLACDRFPSGPYHAVVMGQHGMEMGLAIYEDLDLLRAILSGQADQEEVARRSSCLSVTYGEIFDISPWDLEAAEQHQWPLASPEAYPTVLRVNPGFVQRTPLVWEIELMECCLRAIPQFLAAETESAQFEVTLAGVAVTAHLKWLEI